MPIFGSSGRESVLGDWDRIPRIQGGGGGLAHLPIYLFVSISMYQPRGDLKLTLNEIIYPCMSCNYIKDKARILHTLTL